MKDLLLISLRFPYPPHRGDRIRTYYFLRGLAERFRVSLVSFFEHPSELDGLDVLGGLCHRVWPVPFSRWRGRLRAGCALIGRGPLQNGLWRSPAMTRTVREALDRVGPHAVQVEFFRMAQYLADEPGPKLLDFVDAYAMNLSRRRARDRNPANRLLLGIEERRVRRYEPAIGRKFDRLTVISPEDRDAMLHTAPDMRVEVVPNGVDLEYFQPTPSDDRTEGPVLLFTGTMNYFPNTDAAYHLAGTILPRVREVVAGTRLFLVGMDPPRELRRLDGRNGVVVTGSVEDVRPYFDMADLFVSPMRCGSGLQNKNLEAMAMGVPLVTSSLGAQGMTAAAGRDFVCEDDPQKMALTICRLLSDREERDRLREQGRRYVERHHSWKTITSRLATILDGMMTHD